MKPAAKEIYMRCYRPDTSRPRDPLFRKAMEAAQSDERLRPLAENQLAFDRWAVDRVHEIEVPDEMMEELTEAMASRTATHSWRSPAILSVVLGLLLIAGVFAYFWYMEMAAFDGRDAVQSMVERTSQMTGRELDPLSIKLGALDDWLFMQNVGKMELPPGFSDLTATGARVFQQGGNSVVQLAIEEHDMVVCLFRAADFGVRLPVDGKWRAFTSDEWVAAVQALPDNVIMLTMPGGRSDMRDQLDAIQKEPLIP